MYKDYIKIADEPVHASRASVAREGMEWGRYLTLTHPDERLTTPSLAFFADTYKAFDEVIPGLHAQTRRRR